MSEKLSRSRKVKSPLTKGVAKVPVVMQLEALECGAACLTMIMAYYRKWVPLEQVRLDCGVSRDGSKASNIVIAGQSYGFEVDGYSMDLDSLRNDMTYPCIIHWNFNHFVVLCGFIGDKAVINDPARGIVKIPIKDLDTAFTGIAIQFTPGKDFVPSGKPRSTIEFAKNRLRGAGAAVAFVMLTTVITYLFGLINPAMTRVFYERLLSGKDIEWLYPFTGIMSALCIAQLIVQWVNTVYSLKINGKLAVMGNADYMWKILRLPIEFFTQRMTGDIVGRQKTNASIAGVIVNTVSPLLLNTVMMFVYLIFMIRYSPVLTLVGIVSVFLNLAVARSMSKRRVNLTRVQMRDEGKLISATMAGINMAETICPAVSGSVWR